MPNTFTVNCSCCSGGGVTTPCCGVTIPRTLFAAISNSSGCSGVGGTVTLTYNATAGNWQGSSSSAFFGHAIDITLICLSGGSFWEILAHWPDGCSADQTFVDQSFSCNPLVVNFFQSINACGCVTPGDFIIQVTQ